MVARAIASGTISFGLVSIPVKLFTATSSEQVRFNMLHSETKGRVKQQYVLASTGEVVDRKSMAKGYEYARGQYVLFPNGKHGRPPRILHPHHRARALRLERAV